MGTPLSGQESSGSSCFPSACPVPDPALSAGTHLLHFPFSSSGQTLLHPPFTDEEPEACQGKMT